MESNQSIDETWLPISGFEGFYEVSDMGRVRSVDRIVKHSKCKQLRLKGQILKPRPNPKSGHQSVALGREGRRVDRLVHHLVLETFVSPRPLGKEACHWDDDSSNNKLTNLRWGTRSENRQDAIRNGKDGHGMKTHCPQKHEYDWEYKKNGKIYRGCLKCKKESAARHRAKKRKRS